MLGFLGDFEDLENVSEMVAETSEASKDQQGESATGENNTCTCTGTCRICNLISGEKVTFQREKMSCYVIKAMDNVLLRSSYSGCTWIVGRALR